MSNPVVERVRSQKLTIEALLNEVRPAMKLNDDSLDSQDQSEKLHAKDHESDWSDFHNWDNWNNHD